MSHYYAFMAGQMVGVLMLGYFMWLFTPKGV